MIADLSKLIADLDDDCLLTVGFIRKRLDAPVLVEADGDLSCADIGAILHRKPGTIRGWFFRGELKGFRLNNRDWRCTRKNLREYLDAQSKGTSRVAGSPVDLGSWRKKARRP